MRIGIKHILPLMACLLLTACGDNRKQTDEYRLKVRSHYYERELEKAQAELARTDSLFREVVHQEFTDSVQKRLLFDSLRHEEDVQGAKIRYIHRKQQELAEKSKKVKR